MSAKALRVAVEGLGATVGPPDGAGRYLIGLVRSLSRRDDVRCCAIVGPTMGDVLADIDGLDALEVIGGRARASRLAAQHVAVPRIAQDYGADCVVYLGNYVPIRRGPAAVAIVMNLFVITGTVSAGVARGAYRRIARRLLVTRADAIVAVSETLAEALLDVEPGARDRLTVVLPPHDVADVCAAPRAEVSKLPSRYFLGVGRPFRYRDYPLALDALRRSELEHQFVVLGDGRTRERRRLERHAASLGLSDRLVFAGKVADLGELRAWYESATAYVGTSAVEAYPFPPGEAMMCGTPVIAVRRSGYIEAVDGAGVLVDPDPDALATAMRAVADGGRGAFHAQPPAGYGWDEAADRVLEACSGAVARSQRV